MSSTVASVRMGRHLAESTPASLWHVFTRLTKSGALRVSGLLLAFAVAAIPAIIVGGVWFVLVSDLSGDRIGAASSSWAAGVMTLIFVGLFLRAFARRRARVAGRHQV
jgi:hypothetical protein